MNSTDTTPDSANAGSTNAGTTPPADRHGHPRGAGYGRRGGHGPGPSIVIQNGAPQPCGPRGGYGHEGGHGHGHGHNHGFAPHHDGMPFGPFTGARPKKGDIRLMKRVRSIATELGRYRGTASKEQRAQAVAVLDGAIVEIKRILNG